LRMIRTIRLVGDSLRRVRMWSDASFSYDSSGKPRARLCAIISCSELAVSRGVVCDIPVEVIATFCDRIQQIHMCELLGPFVAFKVFHEWLSGANIVAFIDNMGVLCGLVNGASRQLDASSLIFALHLRMANMRSSVWWDYVNTHSNVADGGSRVGVSCEVAKSLGIKLKAIPFPALPRDFTRAFPSDWKDFWIET
jgi:hypothetical protein